MPDMVIRGPLFFYSETGTEGGYWAIQDQAFIDPPTAEWPVEHWHYEGLHRLDDGDYLKIFTPEGGVYWEGVIKLKPFPAFTEQLNVLDEGTGTPLGLWIHADQEGLDRNFWGLPFIKQYKGELTKGRTQ